MQNPTILLIGESSVTSEFVEIITNTGYPTKNGVTPTIPDNYMKRVHYVHNGILKINLVPFLSQRVTLLEIEDRVRNTNTLNQLKDINIFKKIDFVLFCSDKPDLSNSNMTDADYNDITKWINDVRQAISSPVPFLMIHKDIRNMYSLCACKNYEYHIVSTKSSNIRSTLWGLFNKNRSLNLPLIKPMTSEVPDKQIKTILLIGKKDIVSEYKNCMSDNPVSIDVQTDHTVSKLQLCDNIEIILLEINEYGTFGRLKNDTNFKNIDYIVLCLGNNIPNDVNSWMEYASIIVSKTVAFLPIRKTRHSFNHILYGKNTCSYADPHNRTVDKLEVLLSKIITCDEIMFSFNTVTPAQNHHESTLRHMSIETAEMINQLSTIPILPTLTLSTKTNDSISDTPTEINCIPNVSTKVNDSAPNVSELIHMPISEPLYKIPTDDIRNKGIIVILKEIEAKMLENCGKFRCCIDWNELNISCSDETKEDIMNNIKLNKIRVSDETKDGFMIAWG